MINRVKKNSRWEYLSPLKLTLLAVNAICFGAFIVLLSLTGPNGPIILGTIGSGLSLFAGFAGAIMESRRACKDDKNRSILK